MNFELIEKILILAINFTGIILGIWVLKSSGKAALNRWFGLMTLAVLFWVNFSFLGAISKDLEASIIFYKLNWASVSLFLLSFYYFFVSGFLKEKGKHLVFNYLIVFSSLFFLALSLFSDLIISGSAIRDWGSEVLFGSLNNAFNLYAVIVAGTIVYHAISKYSSLPGKERLKVRFFFVGIFIFILANIVFNVLAPILTNSARLQHFGDYSAIILLLFTGYAIAKHKLMDIRMVVARSVGFILLLLSVAAMAGLLMMTLPTLIFSPELLEKYNVIIRSSMGIVMIFLFQPLREWITKATDRIFFKQEYDLHDLLKKVTDNAYSTLILIELLYKTVDILIKDMKVSKGMFILLDPSGDVHTTQAVGYQKTPELHVNDIKGLAKHGNVFYDDLDDSSHLKRVLKKSEAFVSVALMDKEKPIGILLLGEKSSGNLFNQKDLKFLEILAPEMMVAIQRAEEHEKVQNFNVYLQAEISRKTKELQEANAHLRELDKAKDEFISMASHQLRTPLTAIKGYLSMLMEGDAGDLKMSQYDFVNEAFDGANRMVSLINDLLNVSRMDTGRFFLEPVEIDMERMVNEEIKQLSQAAKEKNLYLKAKKAHSIPKIKADETKIRQVIMNFIDNALYYTNTGGATVILDKEKDNVIFKVEDTGMGVPESEREHLFTKFFRADNARRARPDGTGLGIYLAKKVIEDHGGEIIFESTEGKGSVFGFKLPIKSKIKREITIPPADLQAKAEAIGSGDEKVQASITK